MCLVDDLGKEELRQRKENRIWRSMYAYLLFVVSVSWLGYVGRVVYL